MQITKARRDAATMWRCGLLSVALAMLLFGFAAPAHAAGALSPPSISGTAVQGQTLTEVHATWPTTPTGYAYQWLSCDSIGASCALIAGATQQTYMLGADDVGNTIEVQETAYDGGGTEGVATSPYVGAVVPLPPVADSLPAITGAAIEGDTLSEVHASWSGDPFTFSYQWLQCNSTGQGCVLIANATGQSYVPASADVGQTIRVSETAGNFGGLGTATVSAPTNVVAATAGAPAMPAPPVTTPALTPSPASPAPASPAAAPDIAAVSHATVSREIAAAQLSCTGAPLSACRLVVRLFVVELLRNEHTTAVRTRKVILGTQVADVSAAAAEMVHVALTSAGRALVAMHHKLAIGFEVHQGPTLVSLQNLTFTAPPVKP
jgi:hypothetical protein